MMINAPKQSHNTKCVGSNVLPGGSSFLSHSFLSCRYVCCWVQPRVFWQRSSNSRGLCLSVVCPHLLLLQSCRGHDGCATRYCDPLAKKCGCPPPLLPSASKTACERVLSSRYIKPVNCGPIRCRCPEGARPAGDGVGCVLEQRETVILPLMTETDPCFNDIKDQDESDSDCGGKTCVRRCGGAQRCNVNGDCAANLKCTKVVMSRGVNGTTKEEKRCSCPQGRFLSTKGPTPLCVRLRELCTNGHFDPAHETDLDCGGVCATQADSACNFNKMCLLPTDCNSKVCDPKAKKCVCGPGLQPQGPFCAKPPDLPALAPPPARATTPVPGIISVGQLPPVGGVPGIAGGGVPPGLTPGGGVTTPVPGGTPGGVPPATAPGATPPGTPGVSVAVQSGYMADAVLSLQFLRHCHQGPCFNYYTSAVALCAHQSDATNSRIPMLCCCLLFILLLPVLLLPPVCLLFCRPLRNQV